jgi:hypothetical protein
MFTTTHIQQVALAAALAGALASRHVAMQETQQLHYHLKLSQQNDSGEYVWAGSVGGPMRGQVTLKARFQSGTGETPGGLLIETHWVVIATPASRSIEARLSGTLDATSGTTHLVGAIVKGPGRGQMVETNSQLISHGLQRTLSDVEGVITIWPPRAPVQGHGDSIVTARIADALRAGPDFITRDATVLDWPSAPGGRYPVLRQGTSAWTCLPGRPGAHPGEPLCLDPTFLTWIQESAAGLTPHVDRVGVAYMYTGEFVPNTAGKRVTQNANYHVGPHVMIITPHQDELAAFGRDGSTGMPYINHIGNGDQYFLVVPFQHADQR